MGNNLITQPVLVQNPLTGQFLDVTSLIIYKHQYSNLDMTELTFKDMANSIDEYIEFLVSDCKFEHTNKSQSIFQGLFKFRKMFNSMYELSILKSNE